MSDEHSINLTDDVTAALGETPEVAETPEVVETPETPASPEASGVWNGELESLDAQPWYSALPEEARNSLKSGYGEVRKAATQLLTKRTTEMANERKRVQAAYAEIEGMKAGLQEHMSKLEAALLEGADEDSKIKTLESSYKSQMEQLGSRLAKTTNDARALFQHNQTFAQKIKELEGQLSGAATYYHNHYQGQVNKAFEESNRKMASMEQELGQLRELRDNYEYERSVNLFESAFPHLKGTEHYNDAMGYYFKTMQGLLQANPQADEKVIGEIDEVIQVLMSKKYPNRNPAGAKPPVAETIASPPNSSGNDVGEIQFETNKISMF